MSQAAIDAYVVKSLGVRVDSLTLDLKKMTTERDNLNQALGTANRERERLTREIVEAHRLVGSDGAHSALVSAIARLKKDNADLTLLLEGAKADRPLGLGALVLVRAALEAREEETTLDAARRVVNERDQARTDLAAKPAGEKKEPAK